MPEKGERNLKDMLVRPENPYMEAAEARANATLEQATKGAFDVIDALRAEVETMPMAERFKKTGSIGDETRPFGTTVSNPLLRTLSEAEHKRQQLLRDLDSMKDDILRTAAGLQTIVMDIEATKKDY